MSIHYLIDPFTNNGDIVDVTTSLNGQTDATGSTVIRVPDGVAIHNNPSTLTTLIAEKYDGLLASYAGFPEILADPCLDNLTVSLPDCTGAILSDGFVNHCITPPGTLFSTIVPLAFAPTQAVLVWEEFSYIDVDEKTGRMRRTYAEGSGSGLLCVVSFDGGVNANPVTNGTVFNIPVPDQGASFQIAFGNLTGNRIYLGSWAVVY